MAKSEIVDAEDHGNADVGGFETCSSTCGEGFDSGRRFLKDCSPEIP